MDIPAMLNDDDDVAHDDDPSVAGLATDSGNSRTTNTVMNRIITCPRYIETSRFESEPAVSPATATDGTGRAEFRAISVKPRYFSTTALAITGVALCLGLTSCVGPYDSYSVGSTTMTSYRPGYRVDSLPGGYRSETISGSTYYYHDGSYYRRGSGGYVVVDAPRESRYYDDYSRIQGPNRSNRDHRQAAQRQGTRYQRDGALTRLPDGYRTLNHRGDTYYQAGDRYYRRQGETYVITTRPY